MRERCEIYIAYKRRYINTLPFLSFFFSNLNVVQCLFYSCDVSLAVVINCVCVIVFVRVKEAASPLRLLSSDRRLLCINFLRLNAGEVVRRAVCLYRGRQKC